MKRDWSKFQLKTVVASPEKQNRTNMGRPCCGGSCIGGNCVKPFRKSPTLSSRDGEPPTGPHCANALGPIFSERR